MRNFLILLVVLLAAAIGYAWYREPAGCEELLTDLRSAQTSGFGKFRIDAVEVFSSLMPGAPPPPTLSSVIDGHLVSADGSPFTFPANAPASSLHDIAIYYSAQWCPPCHAFTPVLVDWYKKFKPAHPHFELVFVSNDHDKASWLAYMKETAMPWPAFSFDDLPQNGQHITKFAGSGIPDLVLVDDGGKVLSDSFTANGVYVGPREVMADIEKILGPGTPPPVAPPVLAAPKPTFASPPKAWSPPDITPGQPNWTWTTLDGTTYQNVVVTQIGPETVSITHAMGVAHDIPIVNLPPDIQKMLSYDPAAAAVARKERLREEAHPYYTMSEKTEAQSVAAGMNWPLAWLSAYAGDLAPDAPSPTEQAGLSTAALKYLEDKSIVILINPDKEMPLTPPIVHHQFSKFDDGILPGGANYNAPKVVFSTSDADPTILGRVSYTQMHTSGVAAISEVYNSFTQNSAAPTASSPSTTNGVTPSVVPSSPPATAAAVSPPATVGSSATLAPAAPTPPVIFKPWRPPAVLPAQPNWSWTTSDGTTYNDVVITKLEPDAVSITHSMGVAHDIPLVNLSPSLRRQLNYDPVAAAATRRENDREDAHPYYTYSAHAEAQAVARQMNWPIAWMDTFASFFTEQNPAPDSEAGCTLQAVDRLKSHTIVIVADGENDLGSLPAIVRDQLFVLDDGPLPDGHHFYAPKVVLTDADALKVYGRIAYTQMKTQGDGAFDAAIADLPGESNAPGPTPAAP
jgi:nucleoredoxin